MELGKNVSRSIKNSIRYSVGNLIWISIIQLDKRSVRYSIMDSIWDLINRSIRDLEHLK